MQMTRVVVRSARKSDADQFIELVLALAKFEKLEPPSSAGRRRLVDDVFVKKRVRLLVADVSHRLVGYALYFYSYSSFVAKPTLYLEDLYVLEEYRRLGVGFSLFRRCVEQAISDGCGRMEWAVLTWNEKAIRFYEKLGAKRMTEWHTYRLDESSLRKIPKKAP
jgi:GNAT superfamily N-acetyltransferase